MRDLSEIKALKSRIKYLEKENEEIKKEINGDYVKFEDHAKVLTENNGLTVSNLELESKNTELKKIINDNSFMEGYGD